MKPFYKVILLNWVLSFLIVPSIHAATGNQPTGQSFQPYLRLLLAQDANSSNTEDVLIRFKNGVSLDYVENVDTRYLRGFGEVNLNSISEDGIPLAIDVIPFPQKTTEEVQLDVEAKISGGYSLNMKAMVNIPPLFDVWLVDKYQNDSVNMRKNNLYHFTISKTDTSSFGINRFALVIRTNPAFAYQLLNFTADEVQGQKQVKLTWQTTNEGNYTGFGIERSIDGGQNFNTLDSLQGCGAGHYNFTDINPAGKNTYRLRQRNIYGVISYSKPVVIAYDNNLSNKIRVYPNPVNTTINLDIASQPVGNAAEYEIRFTNSSGILVKDAISAQAQWQGSTDDLQPGLYFIQVLNIKNDQIVGKSKFVKL